MRAQFKSIRFGVSVMLNRHHPGHGIQSSAKGFSLIEMMISIVIGMTVVAGAVSLIVAIDRSNSETIQTTRIDQELRALASMITNDISRSRHLHDPLYYVGQGVATSTTTGATHFVYNNAAAFIYIDTSTPNCIVYGYQDAPSNDSSATATVYNSQAIYLDTTTGQVMFAQDTTSTAPSSPVTCATAGTALNSSQLDVTGLTFSCVSYNGTSMTFTTSNSSSCDEIDLTLSAKLAAGDPYTKNITHTYTQQIFIRSGAVASS